MGGVRKIREVRTNMAGQFPGISPEARVRDPLEISGILECPFPKWRLIEK
jgi:hypothetical protein